MLFMSAAYAAEDDVVAMRAEWQKEVLSDLDKTYGLYAGMPWKDFLDIFNSGIWKQERWVLPYAKQSPPVYVLKKGFREIEVVTPDNNKITVVKVSYYTNQRMTAVHLYRDSIRFLRGLGTLKEVNYVSAKNMKRGEAYEYKNMQTDKSYVIEFTDTTADELYIASLKNIEGRSPGLTGRYMVTFWR